MSAWKAVGEMHLWNLFSGNWCDTFDQLMEPAKSDFSGFHYAGTAGQKHPYSLKNGHAYWWILVKSPWGNWSPIPSQIIILANNSQY